MVGPLRWCMFGPLRWCMAGPLRWCMFGPLRWCMAERYPCAGAQNAPDRRSAHPRRDGVEHHPPA